MAPLVSESVSIQNPRFRPVAVCRDWKNLAAVAACHHRFGSCRAGPPVKCVGAALKWDCHGGGSGRGSNIAMGNTCRYRS